MTITIRDLNRAKDRSDVESLDTTGRRIELVERALEEPLVKRYSIDEVFLGVAA